MTDTLKRALAHADEALAEGRPRAVRRHARKALDAAPDTPDAYAYLAWAELASEKFEDALLTLPGALAVDEPREWYHRIHAMALARKGKLDQAAAAADEAIRLDSEQGLAHALLAQVRFLQGRRGTAQVLARRAAELLPADPLPCRLLGDFFLEDDPAEAEKWYRDSLELEAGQAVLLNNLAVALRVLGRDTEADSVHQSAVLLDSSLSLGLAQYERWDPRLAGVKGREAKPDEGEDS